MTEIFLSASVPIVGRGDFYRDADPFLIQSAVRSFAIAALGRRRIVWGGHPSITPMMWSICEDLGVQYTDAVLLIMSEYFRDSFPPEATHFSNTEVVPAIPGDLEGSLLEMRRRIFMRPMLKSAVFVGGMEGVIEEYELIRSLRPDISIVAIPATGGAARVIAKRLDPSADFSGIDFPRIFHAQLGISPSERRGHRPSGDLNSNG